jgi:dienelactone hydrolase
MPRHIYKIQALFEHNKGGDIMLHLLLGFLMAFASESHRGLVPYKAGVTQLEGYINSPSGPAKKPAVLIVHDWMGLSDFQKQKADELAKMGYVAFAVDIYGQNVRPKDQTEAAQFATKYKDNRSLLRERIRAAFDTLAAQPNVDAKKIIVMGYCFGGTTALELARSGAPLAGTVSFHGGLSTPNLLDAKNIKAPVLALHGADDPWVPKTEVDTFKKEMKDANVDLTFVSYPKAVHAFTNPGAGSDNSKGAAYNAEADKKSWVEFKKFLKKTTGI